MTGHIYFTNALSSIDGVAVHQQSSACRSTHILGFDCVRSITQFQ